MVQIGGMAFVVALVFVAVGAFRAIAQLAMNRGGPLWALDMLLFSMVVVAALLCIVLLAYLLTAA